MDTVTVAMGYYRKADWIEAAVRSVLSQTYRDLCLVIVGDGEDVPIHSRDSRLVVYRLPANRGVYFAQQLVLQASPHTWFAPHGADDWSEPDHLAQLLESGGTAVPRAVFIHSGDAVMEQEGDWWGVGVFDAGRLREIGGYNPAERIEQDTLVTRLLAMTGNVGRAQKTTYHQVVRPGSLTSAPQTGFKSLYRSQARRRRLQVFNRARRMPVDRIRAFRDALVPVSVRDELAEHASNLAVQLQ